MDFDVIFDVVWAVYFDVEMVLQAAFVDKMFELTLRPGQVFGKGSVPIRRRLWERSPAAICVDLALRV